MGNSAFFRGKQQIPQQILRCGVKIFVTQNTGGPADQKPMSD